MTTTPQPVRRWDWYQSIGTAADLSLLGIAAFLACLPVVTAGAAVATTSSAVDALCRGGSLPPVGELARTAARAALPGLAATAVTLAATAVVLLDLRLLATGVIPGGAPAMIALAIVATGAVAVGGATVVRVGQTGGRGWRAAVGWSLRLLGARPLAGVAALVAVALAAVVGLSVPAVAVLLPGFVIFGLHVIVRRVDR
jgi:hypothetical protein